MPVGCVLMQMEAVFIHLPIRVEKIGHMMGYVPLVPKLPETIIPMAVTIKDMTTRTSQRMTREILTKIIFQDYSALLKDR